ncbi:MAG: hypothetical protein JRI68_22870 [Deltaproteobacteria bacterium]|nr:hypothetical protein [Deltaproteobacteria bacterium]
MASGVVGKEAEAPSERHRFFVQLLSLAFLAGSVGYLAYQYVGVSSQFLHVVLP